jgi:hypothetical protein
MIFPAVERNGGVVEGRNLVVQSMSGGCRRRRGGLDGEEYYYPLTGNDNITFESLSRNNSSINISRT